MNMKDRPRLPAGEPAGNDERFDSEAARRILRWAAETDVRGAADDVESYTLEQLQAIGTEAGISPEAVRAAALEQAAADRDATATGWLAALRRRLPASWSPRVKNAVLIGAAVAVLGLFVAIAGVGPLVVALALALLVLILLLVLLGLGPV